METTKHSGSAPNKAQIGLIFVTIAIVILCAVVVADVHKTRSPEQVGEKLDSTGIMHRQKNAIPITDTTYIKQRGLLEYDKGPIMQWVEKAKIEHHVTSQHVEIVPVKGTDERRFITELTAFLQSKGYTVSLADSVCPKTDKRDVSITGKDNCILVHVGYL